MAQCLLPIRWEASSPVPVGEEPRDRTTPPASRSDLSAS